MEGKGKTRYRIKCDKQGNVGKLGDVALLYTPFNEPAFPNYIM